MFLDTLSPFKSSVGYGQLGTRGILGYEGKVVQVRRQRYPHALSTHPPARLVFNLGERFASFSCEKEGGLAYSHRRNFLNFLTYLTQSNAATKQVNK